MSHSLRHDLPVFPVEIFDHIIDLSDDHQVLTTASLVCSGWLPASRRHIFKNITIRPSTLQEFSALCSNRPTFLRSIFHINFFNEPPKKPTYTTDPLDSGHPQPVSLINETLLSWFPSLPFTKSITLHRIKWDSAETLVHFASLLPNVIDVGLGYHSIGNITQVNDLFRAFPSLVSFSLDSSVDTTYQGPFIDLPQPVSNTIIPSHLQCLHLTCYGSRDRFIQMIPLGSIQLSEFYIQISTTEGRIYLEKLVLFIRRHCLNVNTLRMAVIVRHLPAHWDIDHFFDTDFLQILSEFKKLVSFHLIIFAEVKEKLPAWVYEALDRLNPTLDIKHLHLHFQIPEELDRYLKTMWIDITRYWDYQEYFDLPRLGAILRQNKFRNVMPVLMWIHHEDGQKSGLWFKMMKSDRSLGEGYQTRSTVMY